MQVRVAADACPTGALLHDSLAPLIDAELDLSEAPSSAPAILVTDHGDDFTVELDSQRREFTDPGRDCRERARLIAVFVALNIETLEAPPEAPVAAEPQPSAAPERARLGLQLAATAAYASEAGHVAPGAALGLWIEFGAWRFAFDAGAQLGVSMALASNTEQDLGSAEVLRIPLSWSAAYLIELGPFAFGPALGLALDVLHLRGSEPLEPHTGVRANLGLLAAADFRLRMASRVSAVLRIGFSFFPRTYDLAVNPLGPSGETPSFWLGANLAFAWCFAD